MTNITILIDEEKKKKLKVKLVQENKTITDFLMEYIDKYITKDNENSKKQ